MRWNAGQRAFIDERYATMTNAELARAVIERFGVPCTQGQMNSYGANHHLRKAPGVRSRATWEARGNVWDSERDAWLRGFAPGHSTREVVAAFRGRFGVELRVPQLKNRLHVLGVHLGVNKGRFQPGQEAWNKGRPWGEWMPEDSGERSRRTCFAKGGLPHNTEPIGTERTSKDGYAEVKVAERPSVSGKAHDNWVPKAHLVWERANGRPVPDGTIVVFLDGDRTNLEPGNLALETRAEHATIQRLRIPYRDRQTHETAVAIARLRSATYRATRGDAA